MLAFQGLLSIGFGVLLFILPGAGALAFLALIAAYAILFGILLIILGFRLRGLHSRSDRDLFATR